MTPSRVAELRPTVVELPTYRDDRGALVAAEVEGAVPFPVRRMFVITAVPAGAVRAQHANRSCHEALVAASGAVTVTVDDGAQVARHRLDTPSQLLVVPSGTWVTCAEFTPDAALVVLASSAYDPADQITDYAQFRSGRAG